MCALSGCTSTKGRITTPGVTVQGPKDGNNASLVTENAGAVLPLPEGSRLVITKTEAVQAIPATGTTPAVAAQPAMEVTEVVLSRDTEWRRDETKIAANTGTIDTSIATHRIDVAERRWLLWAAIGCGIAGLVSRASFPAWPTISNGLLMAAVAAGAAWKLAEIPPLVFAGVILISVLYVLGYKRREKDEKTEPSIKTTPAS